MKKICCLILTVLILCIALLAVPAMAARTQSLEVICRDGITSLTDVSFYLYRIGDFSGNYIVPDSTFEKYSVSWYIDDTEDKKNLAMTLSGYILRDDPVADYEDTTDESGTADFDSEFIEDGVYILMADKHHQDTVTYFFEPTLVILPYGTEDSLIVIPKFTCVDDGTKEVSISYKVLKAWVEDEGMSRPVEIEVELLKDGEIYDTVTLDADNNWSYTWKNLSVFYHWTVVEKQVPESYKVMLTQDNKALLLSNSGAGEPEDETTTVPDEETTDKDNGDDEPELPVTGTLQWPIPYLALAGVLLIILGYAKSRKSEQADE